MPLLFGLPEEVDERLQVLQVGQHPERLDRVLQLLVLVLPQGLPLASFLWAFWNVRVDSDNLPPVLLFFQHLLLREPVDEFPVCAQFGQTGLDG